MTFRTFYEKSFKNSHLIKKFDMLHIAFKPIQEDSRIKLAIISDYHAICFYGNDFTLATFRIFKVCIMQTLGI